MAESYDLENGLFSKIVRGEIPADVLYQDEYVTAFRDIHPQAPVHVLVVPNRCIPTADHVEITDEAVLGKMFLTATQIARDLGIAQEGYRLVVNCKEHGGQIVYHLHMHLIGGRPLGVMTSVL
jgi:histidine triad (HIT) family protein